MTQNSNPLSIRMSKRRGNMLIVVVIIALFAVVAVMFINKITQDPTGPVEECPWVEIDRIVGFGSPVNMPQPSQINLEEERTIMHTILSEDGENRGRLEILISPDGLVEATWTAKYKEGVYEKEISGGFSGNVDSDKIYEDENGTDPSKLFFITKGMFILQAFKHGNARAGGGEAYVVGWISPDGSANGTLVLVPDKKNTKIYKWGD